MRRADSIQNPWSFFVTKRLTAGAYVIRMLPFPVSESFIAFQA
jgi:hypothetical protein